MHIRNEPRDEYRGPGSDTLAAPRSAADDRDSGIAWSREPDEGEDWVADASSDDGRVADTRRMDIIDEAPAGTERVGQGRVDAERADQGRVEADRADGGRVDAERADAELADDHTVADQTDQAVTTAASDDTSGASDAEGVAPDGELLPGDAKTEPVDAFFTDDDAQGFRARWREVQLRFVDDPQAAAQEAEALVGDAIDGLAAELSARREELAGWHGSDNSDTEKLRMAVRRYREFLDRMLDL
jgi:hypothetical protein